MVTVTGPSTLDPSSSERDTRAPSPTRRTLLIGVDAATPEPRTAAAPRAPAACARAWDSASSSAVIPLEYPEWPVA